MPSRHAFEVLRRQCLCDGKGLFARQTFTSMYDITDQLYWRKDSRRLLAYVLVEPRGLFDVECDPKTLCLAASVGSTCASIVALICAEKRWTQISSAKQDT